MPDPITNSRRVALLNSLGLLSFSPDPSLDRLARVAAKSVRVPMAVVTLLSGDRQINKARVGIDDPDTPLTDAFCVCALDSPELLEVQDALADVRFAGSCLVTGPASVRSYAGQPIIVGGIVLGTVCVMDVVARHYDASERAVLTDLSGLVTDLIQVRLEQLLRQREEQRAFECAAAAGEWLWETDAEHRVTWLAGDYDGEAGKLAGDTLGQAVVDHPLLDWLGNPRKPEMYLSAYFQARQSFHSALTSVGHGQFTRLVERNGTPFIDGDNAFAGFRGSSRDVTDRVRAEIRALDSDAAIRASNSKTEFLSRVSHELRTPLNAILGFAQLMLLDGSKEGRPSAPQRQRLEHIRVAGQQLLALINDMLDLARIEHGRADLCRVPVDVYESINKAIAILSPLATEKRVGLRSLLKPAEFAVIADERALFQVLLNLMSNAVKYNRPGGLVTLRLEVVETTTRLFVEDNGLGISESRMTELFQPFKRLGAQGSMVEGSGLGLVICKALVEEMGGELVVSSVEGVGTSVEVRLASALPRSTSEQAQEAGPADLTGAPSGVARKVLYVEDNPVNVILLEQLFAAEPAWTLLSAADGRTGIEAAASSHPDLILVDMHLPDMNGLQVLWALRDRRLVPERGCIALSADAMPEQLRLALDAGFDAYWTKPLDLRATLQKLRALLNAPASMDVGAPQDAG